MNDIIELNYRHPKPSLICKCGNWKHGKHDVCYSCLQMKSIIGTIREWHEKMTARQQELEGSD